jgi:hypothetical protein
VRKEGKTKEKQSFAKRGHVNKSISPLPAEAHEKKRKWKRNPPNDVLSMMHPEPRVTPCMFCRAIPNPMRKDPDN